MAHALNKEILTIAHCASQPAPDVTLVTMTSYSSSDYEVLKKTIWLEARGEPRQGQIAIAWVVKNRARANRGFFGGGTLSGVCLHPNQFSCWNDKKPANVSPSDSAYRSIDEWLKGVLDGSIGDPTNGALYYINPSLCKPSWTKNLRLGVKIGSHQFYNE